MPKEIKISKQQLYVCDTCGVREEVDKVKKDWVEFSEVRSDGLRLMEKIKNVQRYESFHIPNKKQMCFCSRLCAKKYLDNSINMFLAEISPAKIKPQKGLANM